MDLDFVLVMVLLFIALPWVIMHYITRWKTAATITTDDEALLEELYQLAKRLDERMDTVERLVSHDHPEFQPPRLESNKSIDNLPLRELEKMLAERKGEKA